MTSRPAQAPEPEGRRYLPGRVVAQRRGTAWVVAWLLGVKLIAGCMPGRGDGLGDARLEAEVASYRFGASPQVVAEAASAWLRNKGYRLASKSPRRVITHYKAFGKLQRRYVIDIHAEQSGCTMRAVRQEATQSYGKLEPGPERRDLALEWALVQKLEPEKARGLEESSP